LASQKGGATTVAPPRLPAVHYPFISGLRVELSGMTANFRNASLCGPATV
jgi:hypothetical protein